MKYLNNKDHLICQLLQRIHAAQINGFSPLCKSIFGINCLVLSSMAVKHPNGKLILSGINRKTIRRDVELIGASHG